MKESVGGLRNMPLLTKVQQKQVFRHRPALIRDFATCLFLPGGGGVSRKKGHAAMQNRNFDKLCRQMAL